MEIRHTAHRHGVSDDDIRHALETAIRAVDLDDERRLVIGFDQDARALELVVVASDSDRPAVIHAMPLRPKFQRYL